MSLHSKQPFSCTTAIDVANAGSGTLTWTAPVGRGTSGAAISLVITSSSGHTTTAEFHGVVTAGGNMFSDYHVDGTVTLDQGLDPNGSGGDCDGVTRLQKFLVSTVTLTIS